MGVVCLYVGDYKRLVAYSSVFHIAGCIWLAGLGLVTGWWGVAVVVMMHGVVSAALFMLAGTLGDVGERRRLVLLGGLVDYLSVGGCAIVLGIVLNVGFPLRANMLGELEVVVGVLRVWAEGWLVFLRAMVAACAFNIYVVLVLVRSGQVRKGVEWADGVTLGRVVLLGVRVAGLGVIGFFWCCG